ncbi:MAG: hypothetical protein O3C60_15590 [Planctomycetota bacterium]|nr:hypothetical protein [Planctomycetota bacterium]
MHADTSYRFLSFAGKLVCATFSLLGCSGHSLSAKISQSESAYTEALKAMEEQRFDEAVTSLNWALASGSLSPDLWADSLISRAICHARCGNIDLALDDLDLASGEGAQDSILVAMSYVLDKAGQHERAQQAWEEARRINPNAQRRN